MAGETQDALDNAGTKLLPWGMGTKVLYFFNASAQFITTVICAAEWLLSIRTRNRWPSALGQ